MIDATLQRFMQAHAANSDAVGVQPFPETAARGRRNGVSPRQLDMLRALSAAGGSLSVGQLVRQRGGLLAVARASTSRSLRRLWRNGLVVLIEKRVVVFAKVFISLTTPHSPGVPVTPQRIRGAYVSNVRITPLGIDAVKFHEVVSLNRDMESQ